MNLFAFLAVAYLAGLLVAKLRQARVQLKDASGALEDLQILHENIIQSISSGLITTGLDGHITLVNSAAQKLLERAAGPICWESRSPDCFSMPFPMRESQHPR